MAVTSAPKARFSKDVLRLDAKKEVERIGEAIRTQIRDLRRRGAVVGVSGGIDSSVCAALCATALGPERVFGVFMPEADSDPESLRLGRLLTDKFKIPAVVEDIKPALEAAGCYRRRDEFVKQVVPEFAAGWKFKIVLPHATEGSAYNVFSLVVRSPDGQSRKVRLPLTAYLGIVATTNMKQRTRKQTEYYHGDRLNYAVCGTPNRLEYDQGFFVKGGDGLADVKPIAHLYKTQVYAMARHLQLPDAICNAVPTTDTYTLPQGQDEFYFALPYAQMDIALWALEHGRSAGELALALQMTPAQAQRVYDDIRAKRRATEYLAAAPELIPG